MFKKYKAKNLFYKYLISYVVILLIPISLLVIFFNVYIMDILRNQIVTSNVDSLKTIKNSVDIQINSVTKLYVQILNNEKFSNYAIKSNKVKMMEAQQQLSKYNITNDIVFDIVFYPRDDRFIYASESSYTIDTFDDNYLKYENLSNEAFFDMLNTVNRPIIRPAENVTTPQLHVTSLITFVYPYPISAIKPYATVIFLVNNTLLTSLMQEDFSEFDANTIAIDDGGNIVTYSKDMEYLHSDEFIKYYRSLSSYGADSLTYNNEEFLVSYVKSDDTHWTYITLVPASILQEKLSNVQRLFFITLILVVIIGSIVIYYAMFVNYNPLRQLKNYALKSLAGSSEASNEIEAARMAITYLSEKSNELNDKIIRGKRAEKDYIISKLLNGKISEVKDFQDRTEELGLPVNGKSFRVVIYTMDKSSEVKASRVIEEIEQYSTEGIIGRGKDSLEKNKVIFVYITDTISDEVWKSYLFDVQQRLQEKLHLSSSIGSGNPSNRLDRIQISYIEASSAIDYRLVKGNNKVIIFGEVQSGIDSFDNYPKRELKDLALYIMQGNATAISENIAKLVTIIKDNNTSLFVARCLCSNIINIVMKTTSEVNYQIYKGKEGNFDVTLLTEFQTVDELANVIMGICYDVCDYIKDKNHDHQDLLQNALDYIKKHYCNYHFSVYDLAEHLGTSYSNLGHYFKSQTGLTVISYVNSLRIERAKVLLTTTDKSVKSIVTMVGYSDTSSFIKKFKQAVGMTPGEYRKVSNRHS